LTWTLKASGPCPNAGVTDSQLAGQLPVVVTPCVQIDALMTVEADAVDGSEIVTLAAAGNGVVLT
jgi:hypothetical protein